MKKILFVIDSLACGGAEKSLVTLLSLVDYSKYEVDLQLFGYGGEFEELLPKEVNLLKPIEYMKFSSLSLKNAFYYSMKNSKWLFFISRIKYTIKLRLLRKKNKTARIINAESARLLWESTEKAKKKIRYSLL